MSNEQFARFVTLRLSRRRRLHSVMYAGAMYAWGWLKQLTRMKEQKFSKSTEPMDPTKRDDHKKSYDILWTFSDLVLVTTCFQIDIMYLCNMGYMLKDNKHPGFLQVLIMYITWGPALIYMEIFLGQYVQRGCLYLKNMSPLTCSTIGYAMLSTMYCYTVATVGRLADSYMFLFRSFSSELPWMVCPKGSTPATCIDRALLVDCYLENNRDNCFPKLGPELLSTRIYYKSTHSTFANRAALLLFGWLTIYIALKRTLSDTRIMVKRLLLFMLVLFLCLLTPLLVYVGRGLSVVPFFTVRHGAVVSIGTWIAAFKDFLRDHAVVRGGWQLIGSHIKQGPAAANLTIYSCALTYIITAFCQIFSTGILGVLFFYMKITQVEKELFFPKYMKLFNFYPFALGMLQVRQVWSLIFFSLVALSSMLYTVVNMAILEESMYDNFPALMRYRSYVKVILCILGFIIGVVTNLLTESNSYEDEIVLKIAAQLAQIVVLILTLSVGYIYGMERFSDDMNFLNGSQPTTYWKICWMSLPFGILVLIGGDMIAIKFPRNDVSEMMSNIVYMVLLGLAILHVFYQIVMSMKARNVTGILFQATPLWGPSLPEDRRLRNTYNPREETKYWRKNNLCTHHCLLNKDFILSVIFREINSRTSRTRNNDTLQHDFAAVPKQAKLSQIVIAIDKVSSAHLKTFEDQVEQKVKLLKQVEEAEVNFLRRLAIVPRKRITVTKSMEELNYQIDQMTKQAERKAELDKGNNLTKVQRTSSRMKQRRLPTFVPKETPRPRRTPQAGVPADRKDTKDTDPAKVHTYTVRVPQFVLEPSEKLLRHSAPSRSALKKVNLVASKSSTSRGFLCSKSMSCKLSQQQAIHKPRRTTRKSRLPVWPLPPNTPRPIVSSKLSRSSSSTSTESREPYRQPSAYFLNVRLPPNANLPLPAFSVELHSPPRNQKSPESSAASLELSTLNHDPVLREIIRSVHPRLFPPLRRNTSRVSSRIYANDQSALGSRRREASRPQPEPRTSIAARSPSIGSPAAKSPNFPRPLPRKQSSMNPPVPSPRPCPMRIEPLPCESAFDAEVFCPEVEQEIAGPSTTYEEKGTLQRTEEKVLAVDIDQAIQIRINNLLRGVRNPGQSTDHRPGCLSAVAKGKNVSKTAREERDFSKKIDRRKLGTSHNSSSVSKDKKKLSEQSRATGSLATKISAFGNKMAKRMTRGSTSPRIPKIPQITDEIDERPKSTVEEETPEETEVDLTLMGCEDPEHSSSSIKHNREGVTRENRQIEED